MDPKVVRYSKNSRVEITQDEAKPVPVKVIADSIVKIGKAMQDLGKTRLKDDAVALLVANKSGVSITAVRKVLSSLHSLEKDWLK